MSDVDPDIEAAFNSTPAPASPSSNVDPDVAAAFTSSGAQSKSGRGGAETGAAEMALHYGTGALASIPAAVAYMGGALGIGKGSLENARAVQQAMTYQPRTQGGQAGLKSINSKVVAPVGNWSTGQLNEIDPSGKLAPTISDLYERSSDVAPLLGPLVGRLATGLGEKTTPSGIDNPQSVSAAAASPTLDNVSPELRDAITKARASGKPLNTEAINRHIQAESLPVPIKLTEGQATQSPVVLSEEVNSRGTAPGLADRYNQQNASLVQNLQELRDRTGPDVFSTNPVEHGDTLIAAYKAKDAAAQANITAKYQALKDANGGSFPVDGQQFVTNADAALKANMKRPFLPSGVQSTLDEFRDGTTPMTFENFENLRTTLATESRKAARSGDGNAASAVNLVREQLESLPLSGGSSQVKALADTARSAAKARFDALRADPAYDAAVNDSVTPDRFVSRFVINGARDDVATMRANLAGNEPALQTLGVATLDHLRNQAMGTTGNFAQGRFNKALQGLAPKMSSLVDPQTAEHLGDLGEVARNVQAQPPGSFVNNSNTAVAAANVGKNFAEQVVNAKTFGLGGTLGRKFLESRAAKAAAQKSLAPGAGVTTQ